MWKMPVPFEWACFVLLNVCLNYRSRAVFLLQYHLLLLCAVDNTIFVRVYFCSEKFIGSCWYDMVLCAHEIESNHDSNAKQRADDNLCLHAAWWDGYRPSKLLFLCIIVACDHEKCVTELGASNAGILWYSACICSQYCSTGNFHGQQISQVWSDHEIKIAKFNLHVNFLTRDTRPARPS